MTFLGYAFDSEEQCFLVAMDTCASSENGTFLFASEKAYLHESSRTLLTATGSFNTSVAVISYIDEKMKNASRKEINNFLNAHIGKFQYDFGSSSIFSFGFAHKSKAPELIRYSVKKKSTNWTAEKIKDVTDGQIRCKPSDAKAMVPQQYEELRIKYPDSIGLASAYRNSFEQLGKSKALLIADLVTQSILNQLFDINFATTKVHIGGSLFIYQLFYDGHKANKLLNFIEKPAPDDTLAKASELKTRLLGTGYAHPKF